MEKRLNPTEKEGKCVWLWKGLKILNHLCWDDKQLQGWGNQRGNEERPKGLNMSASGGCGQACLLEFVYFPVTASELSSLSTSHESFCSSTLIYFHCGLFIEHVQPETSYCEVLSKFRVAWRVVCSSFFLLISGVFGGEGWISEAMQRRVVDASHVEDDGAERLN